MNTTFKSPDEFQQAGEVCESCRPFWERQDLPPMVMVQLVDAMSHPVTTGTQGWLAMYDDDGELELIEDLEEREDRHIPIIVCSRCDGDTILRLHKH